MLTTSVKKYILGTLAGGLSASGANFNQGMYMGLSKTQPTPDGTNFTEPSAGSGYEKINIQSTSTAGPSYPFEWVEGTNYSQVQNKFEVHFNVATSDWGTIGWVGIFDSSNRLLAYGHLVDADGEETTINVTSGHIPTINKGAARITIDVEETI